MLPQDGKFYGHGMWVIYDQKQGVASVELTTRERESSTGLDLTL
jgi:hypothetical protein